MIEKKETQYIKRKKTKIGSNTVCDSVYNLPVILKN